MDTNKAWWDERAALHGQDRVYDTEAFLGGRDTLYGLDHETVGDVRGRDLVHLQCHTGMDTLSWLRAGARSVTGLDFSEVAIAKATDTAAAAGLAEAASFVVADVLDVPATLHERFEVCFASIGVFSWISDVAAWMRTAAAVLRPGGALAVVELHPLFVMASSLDPLVLDFPYVNDGPRALDDQGGSYADPGAVTAQNSTVEYGHSLGEIVTAAVQAGLVLERLGEHVEVETDGGREALERDPDGRFRWRHGAELLPILFSLRATKPA